MTEPIVHTFTREALYAAVWAEPIRTLARKLNVSNVALAKACRRAAIPTPEVGHWNRLKIGKPTKVPKLPPRPLGLSDAVLIGRGHQWRWHRGWTEKELLGPIPDPPAFHEPMEEVRERASALVKSVPVRSPETHPLIRKLLDEDKDLRAKQRLSPYSSWDKPRFESLLEKRRLQILNSLFLALQRSGAKPELSWPRHQPPSLGVRIGDQSVDFTLNQTAQRGSQADIDRDKSIRLTLRVRKWRSPDEIRASWEDSSDTRIEDHLRAIAIELLVTAELMHREGAVLNHEWRIQRKHDVEERIQRERLEAERRERERLAALQQARIDRLMKEAAALRMARDIRAYVDEVRTENGRSQTPAPSEQLESWATWAHQQADSIDPVRTGAYLLVDQ